MSACNNDSDGLPHPSLNDIGSSLGQLLKQVATTGYQFVTPTPLTHQRVLANRTASVGTTLRDIFGWNLPFSDTSVSPEIFKAMQNSNVLESCGALYKSGVRIASLDNQLLLHSAYPTVQEDAIFFGPDTYRFVRFIRHALRHAVPKQATQRVLDIGCGSGVGGIMSAFLLNAVNQAPSHEIELVMNDINPRALDFTAVNAAFAGVPIVRAEGDAFSAVDGAFDLIVSNPPYLDDGQERVYRHGGTGLGRALSVRIVTEALPRLALGGKLLLYTGVAIVEGVDDFIAELLPVLSAGGYEWSYQEIDPDIFGEELVQPQYVRADRIAAVGLAVTRTNRVN